MIFDTHAHYDDPAFDADRAEIIASLKETGVEAVMNSGADLASSRQSVELAHSDRIFYAAVGVHPDEAGELYERIEGAAQGRKSVPGGTEGAAQGKESMPGGTEPAAQGKESMPGGTEPAAQGKACLPERKEYTSKNEEAAPWLATDYKRKAAAWDELGRLAREDRVAAIGEIGLDYHWDKWPRELQRRAFTEQWELALSLGLPIVIHSRDAAEDTMNIVRWMYEREKSEGRALRADLHCYSYSAEQAQEYVRMGFMFGIGGVATFKNARKLRETIDILPMDRILLETDCPYLAPEPFRGKRNCSAYLDRVAAAVADVKGISAEQVMRTTFDNACRFFALEADKAK